MLFSERAAGNRARHVRRITKDRMENVRRDEIDSYTPLSLVFLPRAERGNARVPTAELKTRRRDETQNEEISR